MPSTEASAAARSSSDRDRGRTARRRSSRDRCAALARSAAARTSGLGSDTRSSRTSLTPGVRMSPSAGDRFEAQMRFRLPVLHDLQQRAAPRLDRRCGRARAPPRSRSPVRSSSPADQEGDGRRAGVRPVGEPPFSAPSPLIGERARVRMRRPWPASSAQSAPACLRAAAARRPPATSARAAVRAGSSTAAAS